MISNPSVRNCMQTLSNLRFSLVGGSKGEKVFGLDDRPFFCGSGAFRRDPYYLHCGPPLFSNSFSYFLIFSLFSHFLSNGDLDLYLCCDIRVLSLRIMYSLRLCASVHNRKERPTTTNLSLNGNNFVPGCSLNHGAPRS